MDSIGAEVGQKMRSAIKAKLLELNCYVDDELPDYIMVMVANKRTKSQMNEDLNLFLSTKTSTFVDWLHIVLRKLKEVTVTNPEVYKKVAKRKSDFSDITVKKEKKIKRSDSIVKMENKSDIQINKISHNRKIALLNESRESVDNFDIPLLSEVNSSSERDLDDIEKKIKSVKGRLGLLVEDDWDLETKIHNLKFEKDRLEKELGNPENNFNRSSDLNLDLTQEVNEQSITENILNLDFPKRHIPITFESEASKPPKKLSVLKRLGKRPSNDTYKKVRGSRSNFSESRDDDEEETRLKYSRESEDDRKRSKDSKREERSSRERRKDGNKSILSRLGVMSKVYIPQKEPPEPEPEDELKTREVRSIVQVKPRVIPSDAPQANKNLLLKAVAEAHRSVALSTSQGNHKRDISPMGLKTILDDKSDEDKGKSRKLPETEKNKLRNILLTQVQQRKQSDHEIKDMYIPKPLKQHVNETPRYVPSTRKQSEGSENQFNTLKERENSPECKTKLPVKLRLEGRKTPSPIIFDKVSLKGGTKIDVPDKLPIVHPPLSLKIKERCKYWPNCRQGDKCEFVHPNSNCEAFPNCKYKEKCLYLHPSCKFGTSCTKRDCPYSHVNANKLLTSRGHVPSKLSTSLQTCKYFPNCVNINCPFFHPKPCKFGKYCKNPTECSFSHSFSVSKTNLTWRSK